MTRVELKRAEELTTDEWRAWDAVQGEVPELGSAFFHAEFTRIVAAVRGDVEIGVLREGDRPAGFFPFQRGSGDVAQAVVGRLSEFHGVVVRPGTPWTPRALLRGCGVSAWHFDHLPASQSAFAPYRWGTSRSPYMDLVGGYEAYRRERKASGNQLAQVERKARKLEREVGPLRFAFHSDDEAAFERLTDWKSEQHRRTGMLDVLRNDWVRETLLRVRDAETDGFAGRFSTLHAGDRLVAVHLGLVGRESLHVWFPAYDRELHKYSPGSILLLRMAEACADAGLVRIDLGKGDERYKQSFKSGDVPLWEGSVDRRPLARRFRHAWYGTKRWIRRSPMGRRLEPALEGTRRFRQWIAFH